MEKDSKKLEFILGTFVFFGIITIMVMIVFMTGGVSFIQNTYKVVVNIENIGDLKSGASVKLGGVKIGTVEKISIAENDIEVVAGIFTKYNLRTDTTASIATSGLVGDSFLEMTRGKSKQYLKKVDNKANAPRIKGMSQTGMAEMLGQVQEIGGQVELMIDNINKLIGKESFRENIEATLKNVNKATSQAEMLLQSLRKELGTVGIAVDNIIKITDSAGNTMSTIDNFVKKTIGQPDKITNINNTIKNICEITTTLTESKNSIKNTLKNISTTTANIAGITENIDPNSGILRLLSDKTAGNDLMNTLKQVQRAATSLATIGLTDLLADKLAADQIFAIWQKENKFNNAKDMAIKWKEWMSYQKKVNNSIINNTTVNNISSYVQKQPQIIYIPQSERIKGEVILPTYGSN